jgi:hypothetical protein
MLPSWSRDAAGTSDIAANGAASPSAQHAVPQTARLLAVDQLEPLEPDRARPDVREEPRETLRLK